MVLLKKVRILTEIKKVMDKKEEFSSLTIIRDPKIEPYFIGKDSYCYTVYQTITPDTKYTEGNKPGKDYTKALGHYSSFGSCLKSIAKNKVDDNKNYNSIQEYIEMFNQVTKEIEKLTNVGI